MDELILNKLILIFLMTPYTLYMRPIYAYLIYRNDMYSGIKQLEQLKLSWLSI